MNGWNSWNDWNEFPYSNVWNHWNGWNRLGEFQRNRVKPEFLMATVHFAVMTAALLAGLMAVRAKG